MSCKGKERYYGDWTNFGILGAMHGKRVLIFRLLTFKMKKTSLLESSILLSQLESRLNKHAYLSRGALPSWQDARVFLAIERLQRTPDRSSHPALYHWYIIMKQFSKRTLEAWECADGESGESDQLANQFVRQSTLSIQGNNEAKRCREHAGGGFGRLLCENRGRGKNIVTSPKNTKRRISQNYVEFNENANHSQKIIKNSPPQHTARPSPRPSPHLLVPHRFLSSQGEYVMQLQLAGDQSASLASLKSRLSSEKLDLLWCQLLQEVNLQLVFRMGAEECEGLKDRISHWPEVANFRFRRGRKTQKQAIRSQKMLSSPLTKVYKV